MPTESSSSLSSSSPPLLLLADFEFGLSSLPDDSSSLTLLPFPLALLLIFPFLDLTSFFPFLTGFFPAFGAFFSTLELAFAADACIWRASMTPFMISLYFLLLGIFSKSTRKQQPLR